VWVGEGVGGKLAREEKKGGPALGVRKVESPERFLPKTEKRVEVLGKKNSNLSTVEHEDQAPATRSLEGTTTDK